MTAASPLTIEEAASALRSGSMSSGQLVRRCLSAADTWEPAVHALVTRLDEKALAAAAEADKRLSAGSPLSKLDGIPVVVKDLIDIAGELTTAGSRILTGNVATGDAWVASRLAAAGAVLVGKTNTHEFALGALTPPTRNPWDQRRMPGGSSGGSGAAVVTGMALGALGTDTAGSIREPSGLCGIAGLKPTFGRVSRSGVIPLAWSLDCVGPMALTAQDCWTLLSAIEGVDATDPTTVLVREIVSERPVLSGLRVGVITELTELLQPSVGGAFHGLTRQLSDAGAIVEEASIGDCDEIVAATLIILASEAAAYHRRWLETVPHLYQPDVLRYLSMGQRVRAADLVDAERFRRIVCERMAQIFRDVDVLLTPGQLCIAPLVTDDTVTFPQGVRRPRDLTLIRPLCPFSLTGHPAVSVPLSQDEHGLPISAQIVGAPFRDRWLLMLASEIEEIVAWRPSTPILVATDS